MLFLKRLSTAERDGDHIYAVIRGSAENHGGRANSLTAPNPKAQAELLVEAYTRAGIDPRSVGYIEAHGTGTPLGDPIEIQGLKSAFQTLARTSDDELPANYCGLGSVKTNIGHLELAAGIAGVIKVLLQLKHRTLVKSLHCDDLNPYIDLGDSPFYLLRETQPWQAFKDKKGSERPRRAGISSFGFGGVNAHIVLEEYVGRRTRSAVPITPNAPALILLSAKNDDRLDEQAQQLLQAIETQNWTDADLADIAYTLQVGRDAMESRMAFAANSIDIVKQKLRAFVAGETKGIEDFSLGNVKRDKETATAFNTDEELQEAIAKWIARGKHVKLLDLWTKGVSFDWNMLYGEIKPKRISLPTYPFAQERYWAPDITNAPQTHRTDAGFLTENNLFNEGFYGQLLDDVANDTVSIDEAVARTRKQVMSGVTAGDE